MTQPAALSFEVKPVLHQTPGECIWKQCPEPSDDRWAFCTRHRKLLSDRPSPGTPYVPTNSI